MNLLEKIFSRENHTCPWWLCFTFDNPARRIFQNPYRILAPYIKPGNTILDIGPGMGYFTFPMAQLTGEKGMVTALDIQEGMSKRLAARVKQRNIPNISVRLYDGTNFNIDSRFDFVLLFWMFHEVREKVSFVRELKKVLKPDAKVLITEPPVHVSGKMFRSTLRLFTDEGFAIDSEPRVSLSRAAVLKIGTI